MTRNHDKDNPPDGDHPLQLVANVLAGGVAGEISRPLRALRQSLAVIVERLDRYVVEAPGPAPYPWKSLQSLRQELADVYLLSRELARLASDLHESMTGAEGELQPVDVNKQVEAALNLARHRLGEHTEVFVDLGSLPPVCAVAGELALAVAALILCCAESCAAREGSAVSVKTYRERAEEGESVVISVADNGAGIAGMAASAEHAVGPTMARLGGSFEGVSEPEQGSVFELRIPVSA